MDEQRIQAYLTLIHALLNCPNGEELQLLQANSELVDVGLVQVMVGFAQHIREAGNENTANWLLQFASQLAKRLGIDSTSPTREDYHNFLMSVLKAVENNPTPQSVYPLLQQNLDKLNDNLAQMLEFWARKKFAEVTAEEAAYIAEVIFYFSNLIQEFPLGNIPSNKEIALAGCQTVATIFTESDFPQAWAMTQNNLAAAYCNRIKGDKAENIETAIALYHNALRIRTESDFPQDWADTQYNLANAYFDRIKGDKAENIENAIALYHNALRIHTESDFPQDWAMTQNNLAIAYSNRIKGDKADNLENAIALYDNALRIYTESDFPQYWAMTQNNLAAAYFDRIKGDKAENLENAIALYDNALRIYTESDFPQYWAMTQNNLAAAYFDRIKGDKAENLENAIALYDNALRIRTPENFPIDCLQSSLLLGNLGWDNGDWQLAIRGYEIAIKAVETSRSWVIDEQRRQEIIADVAYIYNRIVKAYLNIGEVGKAFTYTERFRGKKLVDMMASSQVNQGGGIQPEVQVLLDDYEELQRRINQIRFGYQSEANLVLAGSRQLRNGEELEKYQEEIADLEKRKKEVWQEMRKYDPVLAGQVEVEYLKLDEIQGLIENDTTALLSFYTSYIFILRRQVSQLSSNPDSSNPVTVKVHTCQGEGLETFQKWIAENWFIPYLGNKAEWQDNMGGFLEKLAQRLQLDEVISRYLGGIEELIVIPYSLLHQMPFAALPVGGGVATDGVTDVTDGVADVVGDVADGVRDGLRDVKNGVTDVKNGGMVGDAGIKGELMDNRGLVMGGKSKAAVKVTPRSYLGDKFRIRLIPSCQILSYCQQRPQLQDEVRMGIVEDATEDLLFTRYECETIAKSYHVVPERRLQGRKATVNNYKTLAQEVQILHSSHHAKSNPIQPLESVLSLGDGFLTLGQLLTPGWRMPNLFDVFASCCEVNFGVTDGYDNLLSLATGFLCAGARNVVSTQWSVDDLASALLAIFYYNFRDSGMSRSQALQQSQIKLRNLTGTEFVQKYQADLANHLQNEYNRAIAAEKAAKVKGDEEECEKWQELGDKIKLRQAKLESLGKEDFPFSHPVYWGGFVSHGMA